MLSCLPSLLVLVLALAAPLPAADGRGEVYALVDARLEPGDGPAVERATLVIRRGLIEAAGATVKAPPDARVLDARGLTLTPGLIDAFGGVGLPEPKKGDARGGLSGLRPEARAIEAIKPAEVIKARDAGITTALVIPREGVLPGRSVLLDLSGESAEQMALRQPAALHLHLQPLARDYPASLMGVMALARQQLLDARRYRQAWTEYEQAPLGQPRPRYDAGLEAWQEVLAGRLPLFVSAPRENDLRRVLQLRDEFGVKVVAANAREAAAAAGWLRQEHLPVIVGVDFDPPQPVGYGDLDEERERRRVDEAERTPARLHEAGLPFALASGYARDFLAGLRKAIERGLPREAALRAVTLSAAQVLGVADRTGSLAAGKLANVVAWSGTPLTKEAAPKWVFVDGVLYEPEPKAEKDEKKDAAPAASSPGGDSGVQGIHSRREPAEEGR